MHKIILRFWAFAVVAIMLAAGTDLTLRFVIEEELYPVNVEDLAHKEDANRRSRQEERVRIEEEDEEEGDDSDDLLLPLKPKANPFIPNRARLPRMPDMDLPHDLDFLLAKKFDARDFQISAFDNDPNGVAAEELSHCKAIVEQTLSVLPSHLTASLDTMTLYFNEKHEPRGLANSHIVELKCGGLSDREIMSVLIHELGHVADLGAFRGGSSHASAFVDGTRMIPIDDLSAEFYALSWEDSDTKKFSADRLDFVSGYAMSDPFEDFAETFIAYILHGDDFRVIAAESQILQAKYDFLKKHVFTGVEYISNNKKMASKNRVWDITILDFDTKLFISNQNQKSEQIAQNN